jgi:hypothetical protein
MPTEAAFDDKDVVANKQESCRQDSYHGNGYNGETGVRGMHGRPKDRAASTCDWRKSFHDQKKKKVMVFFRSRIYKKTKTDILEKKETMVLA